MADKFLTDDEFLGKREFLSDDEFLGSPATKPAESGILGTLGGGAAQTARSVGAFADLAQGDTPELQAAAAAQAARVKDPRLAAFEADLQQRRERLGKDPGWLDVIGEVGSAAWKNPVGAGLMTVDQLPNSAAVLAGGGAGALAGSALGPAGTAAGGIVGGIAGMYAGNLAVEGGGRALEHVSKTGDLSSDDRSRLLYEGAIKAGVITGVDTATFGVTKFITNAGRRAVETATLRVAEQAGVTTAAEIAARRAADPAFDAAITTAQKLAMDGATTFGKRAMQTGAALGLETIGEGLGEYLGEFAATGEADKMDAVIEAFSSLGQSAAEVGIAKAWNSRTPTVDDIAAAPTIPDAIATAEAALAAPIDTLAPAIDAFKSEWSAAAEAARVPADSAIPMVGMPEQPVAAQPVEQPVVTAPIIVPDRPAGPALIALAEQLAILPAGEQTKALMRLDADMRQRVVQTMRALDPAVPSGIVTPDAGVQPGHGEAARITNEATVAASSVQPVAGTAVTNVPAYTQRAAQEIVSKDPSQEMRPHREVAGRFEVVPIAGQGATQGALVPPTLAAPATQQALADQESPAMPAAPAARPAVPAAPLTAEQRAANQAAADAERSSQPRPIFGPQSQLRSETGPDIKGEKVTRNMRKVLVLMGRITGTKVVFEFAPGSSDGAVPNRSENTVHINTAAQINPMQVMGHEVTHVLRDRHAKAWASVRDALVATMPDKRKALDAFAADYWGGNAENKAKLAAARAMPDWSAALTPEQKELFHTSETVEAFLLDEMVSDLGGQHWSDEKFWLDVFAKIEAAEGAKAKSIIERMVMAIRETLGKFLAVVRAQEQGDYATISPEQIEATRDAISSAYAAFIRGERTVEPDQGEHTTEHRINTSRTHSRSQAGEGEPAPVLETETDDELSDARARELASLSPARAKRDQRLFFEVAPKPSEAAAWNTMSDAEQRAVSEDIKSRVIPGLLKDIGVTGTIRPQLGGWMEDTNPSFALVVTRGDPAVAARAVGYVLDQEAVYALGLKPFTGGEKTGIIHFNIASSDRALVHKIYTQIRALDSEAISGHSTLDNEMYIGLPVERMNQLEQQVVSILDKAGVATVYFDEGFGAMIGENDYGMQSDQGSSARLRAQARNVNQWRDEARKLRGRSNAAGSGSDRTVSRSEARPSYGEAIDQHAGTVTGVHYSGAKRTELSSEFYGTGYRGAERARLAGATDPRIKRRVYFYTNNGSGINPETGVGYHAHSVDLNNMYDGDSDPLNLWESNISQAAAANKFESNVIDAGYDGYYTRNFGKNGAAVLLGTHTVPVQYDGPGARPDVPRMSEARKPVDIESAAFKRWFGDSKVRTSAGIPLRVYHGTGADIEAFDPAYRPDRRSLLAKAHDALSRKGLVAARGRAKKQGFGYQLFGPSFSESALVEKLYDGQLPPLDTLDHDLLFFTSHRGLASEYAEVATQIGTGGVKTNGVGRVMPVYLRMENPVILDFHVADYTVEITLPDGSKHTDKHVEYARWNSANRVGLALMRKYGGDGLILRNVADSPRPEYVRGVAPKLADVYVVTDGTQVKSAISNTGEFSSTNPDIRRSEARPMLAALQEIENGKLTMEGEYGYNTFRSLWKEAEGMRAEYPDERTYDLYKDNGGTGVVYGAGGYNRYAVTQDGTLRPIPESFSNKDKLAAAQAALAAPVVRMTEARPATWWYSPLARQADAAQMKKAPASGWKSWLKSLAAKGVKPDEIKWSGIEEWLDAQGEAQVTREQVQAYLSEFGVKIETILRGERSPVTDTTQDADGDDSDIELNVGNWETDDPDESWLSERASDRFDEVVEDRVDEAWEDIADDIEREARTRIEVDLPDITADVRRQMGDMFAVDETLVEQVARSIAAAQVAGDTWQEYTDDSNDMTDEAVQVEAVDRAFAVLSGDMDALETEARRRARAEIDDDKLLEELTEQERTRYYDDYDSPQTRGITVDGVDGTFWDSTSYGDRNVYYDGRDIPLPRRADDADVEGAIRQFVMEEGLVSGSSGGSDSFRATRWDDYATDKRRAVPGSYREVQLTLPVGAFGLPKTDTETGRAARMSVKDYYYTTHWSEADVIGFARWDEHTDSDGKRVMVLQEVQGDWGQQRREGLAAREAAEPLIEAANEASRAKEAARKAVIAAVPQSKEWGDGEWRLAERTDDFARSIADADGAIALNNLFAAYKAWREADAAASAAESNARDLPDTAPFIEKTAQWAGLVLKRMIAHAVEAGFDKVVWTSGAQQVERWRHSLRKQVDTIAWEKTADGIHIVASQNGRQRTDTRVSETALSDAIGKQMAKQIIADPNQSGEITGDDITISDTGMAGFYDRMLPTIANDILRKFDKDVRVKDIEVHPEPTYRVVDLSKNGGNGFTVATDTNKFALSTYVNTENEAANALEKLRDAERATKITTQQGFEITDKLRESAAAGMPLFSQRRASAEARLSHARKEWYRSQLSEAVGGLPAKIKTGKEAALWLTSNAGKLQVKKDELTWSGVLDWLATQRSVTGAQIQDWLASNGVRVRTVMLGGESDEYRRLGAELAAIDGDIDRLRSRVVVGTNGMYPARDEIKDAASGNEAALRKWGYDGDTLDDILAYGRALNRKNELFELRKEAKGETPKHDSSSLRIPGGKPGTYRELLLTLPESQEASGLTVKGAGDIRLIVGTHGNVGSIAQNADGTWGVTALADIVTRFERTRYPTVDAAIRDIETKPAASFRSSHYTQLNILAHLRFEEMIDADGKRVMFIQEVQSDWGQKGRKEGFAGTERTAYQVVVDGNPAGAYESMAEAEAAKQRALKYNTPEKVEIRPVRGKVQDIKSVPAAPFVTDTKAWVALALKRAISHAVDNGFDRVAWTTGEQQNDRYDLSKQVSYIRAIRNSDDTYWVLAVQNREGRGGTGDILFDKDKLTEAELENTIGKDLTQKIIKQEKRKEHEYTGLDLKVGGEGMVAFYDGIVKQVARSLGATVGTVSLPNPYRPSSSGMTMAEADANLKKAEAAWKPTQPQPGFDITDKMREQAAVGMPLFSERRAAPALDQWLGKSVVRGVMYHGTARDISTFRPQQADAIFLTDDPKFAAEFSDLSHSWMLNNFWTWMTPDQIQEAKADARRMLLADALPGTPLYMREIRMLEQSQQPSQYMRRAVEKFMPSESNIMPLYVRAENPFDYRNPQHVQQIEQLLGGSWMGNEFINGEMVEVAQHIGDLERGDWNAIESPQVQEYIRAMHDSFYVRERGVTNLAVFSPNQVKSASGNDGAYSREDNDIRRSEARQNTENLDTAMRRMDKFVTAFEAKQVKESDVQLLGPTPTVLQALGAGTNIMSIDGHTVRKVLVDPTKHTYIMTAEMLRDLPRGLYDPLMVFDSPNPKTGQPGKLFVTEINDRRKNPIVGAVHLSKRGAGGMVINDIASYYGLEDFMNRAKVAPSLLEYIRSEEALAASATSRSLNLSLVAQKARELGRNIQTEQDIVNQYGDKYSTPRSRMSGQPINQSWTDPDVTDWDDFVRKMQDDKIDTKRVLRAIRDAGVAVKEKFDAYLLETNYHGRAAARVDAFADGELRKLMEDMAMRKLTMQDLDDYLWARHAPERNAANNRSNPAITDGSGMSDAQSAAILAGQAVTVGARTIQLSPAALRAAQAVASRVDAITNGTLDLLVSSGLETQQTVDTWKRTYAHYAPLKRDMESDANYSGAFGLGNGTGTGFSVRGAASKRALGSKRAVTDVLANIAMQRERAITRSEKNRVAQAVYGLALSAPNPEFWIPVNPELNKKLSPSALQAAIAELVAIGVNPLDAKNLAYEPVQRYTDPKTGLEMQRINPQLRGRDDVLSTRINGEERYVFFSNKKRAQEMVRGLKNLDAASVSGVLQFIAPVTRWFASINTQYNPIFGMTNGIRDFSTGMLNLSSTPLSADRAAVAKYAFDALRGVYADLRDHRAGKQPTSQWAQLFEQFAMDGGKTGYRDAFATSTDRAEAIAKELAHAGKGKQWVTGGERHSAVFGWLSDYNTAVENAMRLSAYKVALDKGMSRDAAASLAKNLTVNFNKKGLAATQTGALYAFFNAAVQGTARIGETTYKDGKLTDAGKKILYGGMMLGVLQAMLGAAAGWDDDEPPQFQREKNFIIPILGTDKVINVPMPLGFHVIPNIGRITAEFAMSGFRDPGKRLVRLAGLMLDAFNPIGSGTLAQTLSPTIGDPIIALGENKDWTGKSIFKEDFNKMHPTAGWTRTKDSASPPSRWLSYGINYITGGGKYEIGMASPTPDQIDYLVGQATGGVGRELLKTAQYAGSKVTGEELPLYKTPLGVGRFVGETKGQSSETGRFYRNLERIGEHKSALEAMKDDGNGEAMRAYIAEHPDARLVQVADRAQREIGYLRRQKREVIAKGGNTERVKMLEERITATTRRYNEMFKAR